ncbi:LVIVD repeat-containing protein [Chitinophaga lutea]
MNIRHLLLSIFAVCCLMACTKDNARSSGPDGSGGKGGSLARFALNGTYLYTVSENTLFTFQISGDGQLVGKSESNLGFGVETIFAYEGKLYIGSNDALFIFSLRNPDKPSKESRVQHFRSCDPVVTQGKYAYVTLRGGGSCGGAQNALLVFDVSNGSSPALKKTIELTAPIGLGVNGKALYVCDGAAGMRVFDITNPADPSQLAVIKDGNSYIDVIPYEGVLIVYMKEGVRFYDISKPLEPVLMSSLMN